MDSLIWIPGFGFLGLDSWIWIPGFGFLGLDSCVWIPRFGFLRLDSCVWIPGFGFLRLDSWVWIQWFGFPRLDSWVWSPGFGFLGLESWIWNRPNLNENPFKTFDLETKIANHEVPLTKPCCLPRGKAAPNPVSFYKPSISWRAHCKLHSRGEVDWGRLGRDSLILNLRDH